MYQVRPGPQYSTTFQYETKKTFLDGAAHVGYVACVVGTCYHSGGLVVGCHTLCLHLLAPAPLERSLRINQFQFEPRAAQELARSRWLKDTLASRLTLPRLLPLELRQCIAGYLLKEYAVSVTRSLSLGSSQNRPTVDFLTPLAERLVSFQCQTYVGSLVNKPQQSSPKTPPSIIYVSHDHHGILQVIATDSGVVPAVKHVCGVWWKMLRIPNPSCRLELHGDVRLALLRAVEDYY